MVPMPPTNPTPAHTTEDTTLREFCMACGDSAASHKRGQTDSGEIGYICKNYSFKILKHEDIGDHDYQWITLGNARVLIEATYLVAADVEEHNRECDEVRNVDFYAIRNDGVFFVFTQQPQCSPEWEVIA